MKKNIWQLQDAKSKFSEVVARAMSYGTQIVTRNGKKAVVIMAYDEYERLTRKKNNLAEFLLESPLAGSELVVERDKSLPRNFDIEP